MLEKYDDYTVKDLRESLRQYDLPVSGSKSELIERLVDPRVSQLIPPSLSPSHRSASSP